MKGFYINIMDDSVPDSFILDSSSLYFSKSRNTVGSTFYNKQWILKKGELIFIPSSFCQDFFIQKTMNNLLVLARRNEYISIYDLSSNTLIKHIQTARLSPNTIQVSDHYLIFSLFNEINVISLLSLSPLITLSVHNSKIKKLALSNKGKILSFSNKLIFSDIHSDEIFKFDESEANGFLYTENFQYVVLLNEQNSEIWNLNSKKAIIHLGRGKSDQVYVTADEKFLIFSHFEVPMKNWNRLKKKNTTIDIINTQNMQVELGILYKNLSKFVVLEEKIVYLNPEGLFQNWQIREVPILSEELVMTSCYQQGEYLYIGCCEGFLHLFNVISGEELKKAEIHEGDITIIALKHEFVVTGSVDETINICQKSDFTEFARISMTGLSDFCCLDNEIVAISLYGEVNYWKFPTGELVYSLTNTPSMFTGVKYISPYLLISCTNKGMFTSLLYHPLETWPALSEAILTSLSASHPYIAAGCLNGTVLYWSTTQTLASLSNTPSPPPVFTEITGNAYKINSVSINPPSTHILYLTGDTCRIWSIKSSRHVFSFDCLFSNFLTTTHHLSCVFINQNSTKTLAILERDTKALSKKSILLLLFRHKYKLS